MKFDKTNENKMKDSSNSYNNNTISNLLKPKSNRDNTLKKLYDTEVETVKILNFFDCELFKNKDKTNNNNILPKPRKTVQLDLKSDIFKSFPSTRCKKYLF
jgi:hypothetical protein